MKMKAEIAGMQLEAWGHLEPQKLEKTELYAGISGGTRALQYFDLRCLVSTYLLMGT